MTRSSAVRRRGECRLWQGAARPLALLAVLAATAGAVSCQGQRAGAERAGGEASAAAFDGSADSSRRDPGQPACAKPVQVAALPRALSESSGLAASRKHPGILWTHNDSGGEAAVYAIDATGRLLGTVGVTGARNRDWEDIALGPCPAGECLYIGDIGDNAGSRPSIDVYVVPEPAPTDGRTAPARHLVLTYPDGPRDAEALYVMPDASIYIVSKGRGAAATLYRVPAGAREDSPIRLQSVQTLSVPKPTIDALVTGADASPDGRWVAVRTYAWLQLYRPSADGRLAPVWPAPGLGLEDAGETQGEAVAFGAGDTIWLSSEAGPLPGGEPSLGRVVCRLP